MNYLAHIFLSGGDGRVQVGNFMADAVKGSSFGGYPEPVVRGIRLHRAIDHFTDTHPEVKRAVNDLKPHFGRYSGALLDIYFDHLLASRFGEFSRVPLERFSRRFYWAMILNKRYLPDRIRGFMWHFIMTGRLSKYATVEGIEESVGIMARYGRMKVDPRQAADYLREHEAGLRAVFSPFFAELQAFCRDYIHGLSKRAPHM